MKRILSLAILIASTSVFAQPYTETFDDLNIGGSYVAGDFTGVEGITYSYVEARTALAYPIDGEGLLLRRNDEPSRITATYPNGLSQFSFQYRKAHTGGNERALDILVDGNLVETTPIFGAVDGEDDTIYTYTLPNDVIVGTTEQEGTNKQGAVTITIQISTTLGTASKKNRHVVIDNIVWGPYDEAVSVKSNEIEGLQVYPNPATDVVNISSDANALKEVAIFDLTGKKVLETETMNSVNVSSLNAGVYMLQVEENGKKSSRKLVIK